MSPIIMMPGSVPFVQLVGITDYNGCFAPCAEISGFKFNADGRVQDIDNNYVTPWWSEAPVTGIGNSYQIRATLVSGVTPSGPTLGLWHNMSGPNNWSVTRGSVGVDSSTLTIAIRDIATETIQASDDYTMTAEVVV